MFDLFMQGMEFNIMNITTYCGAAHHLALNIDTFGKVCRSFPKSMGIQDLKMEVLYYMRPYFVWIFPKIMNGKKTHDFDG